MPTRTRSASFTGTQTEKDYRNGSLIWTGGPWAIARQVSSETIHYSRVLGNNPFSNCAHVAWFVESKDTGQTVVGTDGVTRVFTGWYGSEVFAGTFPVLPFVACDLAACSAEAWEEMKPTLRGDFSGLNFLGDLKATANLVLKPARTIAKMADSMLKNKGRHAVGKRGKGQVNLVKKMANGHLSWIYGVVPFDTDVKYLLDCYVQAEDKITKFVAEQGKLLFKHHRKTLQSDGTTYSQTSGSPSGIMYKRKVTTRYAYYNAGMSYSYQLPAMTAEERWIRAWLDILGIHPGSALWDYIPLSFVADWFLNLGDRIRASESDWLEPIIKIGYFVNSFKQAFDEDGYKGHVVPESSLKLTARRSSKSYSRNYAYPAQLQLEFDPKITLGRGLAGTSLALQRLL